jgi:hypothetical protein
LRWKYLGCLEENWICNGSSMMSNEIIISQKDVESRIFVIRGVRVMVDSDLAEMYSVDTKRLNEQARRNVDRFPEEFRFQLTESEFDNLRSQIGTSSSASLRSQIATLESDETILRSQIVTSSKVSLRSQIVTLESDETILRSQIATSSEHGGRRYLPSTY